MVTFTPPIRPFRSKNLPIGSVCTAIRVNGSFAEIRTETPLDQASHIINQHPSFLRYVETLRINATTVSSSMLVGGGGDGPEGVK